MKIEKLKSKILYIKIKKGKDRLEFEDIIVELLRNIFKSNFLKTMYKKIKKNLWNLIKVKYI